MRTTFFKTLFKKAKKDKNIMLVTGDTGFSVFESFIETLPAQYLNAGIAEQNMTGVVAGIALEGKIPVMYGIIPFVTMRNFEQIRNDICYQNLNVKIVGVAAGFSYGPYGHTHHSLEDIGILRTLGNLVVLCPGDPVEVRLAVNAALKYKGPVYIRLGKAGEPVVHKKTPKFTIGKGILIEEGKDITIFATSTMLYRGLEVTEELKKKKLSVRFISMPTIKPIDEEIIIDSARKTKALFTLEEHVIHNGLGSAVAEVLAENSFSGKFKRFGVPVRFTKTVGYQEHMRKANGLTTKQIVQSILKIISSSPRT
jgi:transketolase